MRKKKPQRGGSREGSGRKKKPESKKAKSFTIVCYLSEHRRYRRLMKKHGLNHRQLLEQMLNREEKAWRRKYE